MNLGSELGWKSSQAYLAIVEHSMCQPGLPSPQGEAQDTSPGLAAFHSAKSPEYRLSESTATAKAH